MLKKLKGIFFPLSGLERSRLSLDCLQRPDFSSCHSFGFSPSPGMLISWKAGGGRHSEELGQVERGFEIASSDVSTSKRPLFSRILNLLCSFVISFD